MNAPSSPVHDETPMREQTRPDTGATSRLTIRRLPSITTGSLYWLRGKRQKPSGTPVAHPPRPVLTVARPRRMKRCGRMVVFWVLIWYAAFLLFPILREHRWQRIAQATEARKWPALRHLVKHHPERPLVVMLGSSRGHYAFRAGSLNGMPDSDGRPLNVFNFANPATGPITQLFLLRDLLAEGIRPRFVLLEFLPPLMCEAQRGALTEEGMTGFESVTARRFLQWYPYLHRREKRAHLWLAGRINPYFTFRHQIHLELRCLMEGKPFPDYDPMDKWGWRLGAPVPLSKEEHARRLEVSKGGYSPGLGKFRLGQKPEKAIREILDLCRREKIPAALVVMPESSDFRSWYSENATKSVHGLLDELRQTYGVPVIDANTWIEDPDFEDGHHVQLHGTNLFTFRMAAELGRLLDQSKDLKSD